jgi:hypothetical protein
MANGFLIDLTCMTAQVLECVPKHVACPKCAEQRVRSGDILSDTELRTVFFCVGCEHRWSSVRPKSAPNAGRSKEIRAKRRRGHVVFNPNPPEAAASSRRK